MKKEDVLLIANEAIINFPYSIKEPVLLFLRKDRFSRYLDLMRLKKHLHETPCFVAEMKGGSVLYFCLEIMDELIQRYNIRDNKMFLRAVTLHELYHVYNKMKANNEENAVFSELLVYNELKKDFPDEYEFLKKTF